MITPREADEPASRRVARQLQEMIYSGGLQPGDQLPPERKLASSLNVSRTAVREALATLAGAGLVELSGQGAVIRQQGLQHVADAFATLVVAERTGVLHLLETRLIIETQAVQLAAERRRGADLDRLSLHAYEVEDAVAEGRDATDPDTDFHQQLVRCAHNPILEKVFRVLEDAMRHLYGGMRSEMLSQPRLAEPFLREHRGIVEELRQGHGDAASRLVRSHILRASEYAKREPSIAPAGHDTRLRATARRDGGEAS